MSYQILLLIAATPILAVHFLFMVPTVLLVTALGVAAAKVNAFRNPGNPNFRVRTIISNSGFTRNCVQISNVVATLAIIMLTPMAVRALGWNDMISFVIVAVFFLNGWYWLREFAIAGK